LVDKLKVYLETTMFSFYYEERDRPDYIAFRRQTIQVFDLIKTNRYEMYSSSLAVGELLREPNIEKRNKTLRFISNLDINILRETDEIRQLASIYLDEKAVPVSEPIDAMHIAMTAVNGLDFIVSFNFEHIVRAWTIERVRRINLREGYKPIGIYRPEEVLEL
jgi:hypothetical protein